jgi:hypothetical protein
MSGASGQQTGPAQPLGVRATRTGGRWQFARARDGANLVLPEYESLYADATTQNERNARHAEFRATMKAAAEGRAVWDVDVKLIRRYYGLLELRWDLNPFPNETPPVIVRLYFFEPAGISDTLLALHWARKATDGDVATFQNQAIDAAWRRYREGQPHAWGLL